MFEPGDLALLSKGQSPSGSFYQLFRQGLFNGVRKVLRNPLHQKVFRLNVGASFCVLEEGNTRRLLGKLWNGMDSHQP
jgi:hypothetical protein